MNEPNTWETKNQKYLVSCIEQVKAMLKSYIEKGSGIANATLTTSPQIPLWEQAELQPAIEYVCQSFGLSNFERLVLLLCTAIELDSEVAVLCAKAHGNPSAVYPTFSLALAAFPKAHWSALTPASPLRRFRLINLQGLPQVPVTKCQLRIEEKVLHYIAGVSYLDESLQGGMEPVCIEAPISDSQKLVASAIIHAWKSGRNPFHIQLSGPDELSKRSIASWACRQLGIVLWRIPWEVIPERREEQEPMAQIWSRESALMNAGLYIMTYDAEPAVQKVIRRFMSSVAGPVFLSTNEPWKDDTANSALAFEVSKPTKVEQRDLWKVLLLQKAAPAENDNDDVDASSLNKEIARVVNQFNLNTSSIQSAVSDAVLGISSGNALHQALWSASLGAARPRLSELAQRIVPTASMDDLVLPEKEKRLLWSITASVKQRYRVYEEWGFGKSQRGLGIVALFSGDSGTGKTMAAEVIASELELDLFRIDLSVVVSKYIGETEKNLRRIFDAAEDGGSILLFDEADALFGKRSEIRSSHDRYANIEVGYLLQRLEAYSGLAILTTNMKESLDKAFLRRIRFVVKFPNPNHSSRKEIWKNVFPRSVPLDNNIDYDRLAQLDVTGGHIRNIALGASMMAAEDGAPVGMAHVASAAKEEYDKMERPMPAVWSGGGIVEDSR
jgi:AAA+ superfamily predicted ATPase